MKYFKKLVGKQVYLSPMRVEDAETYTMWLNDLTVTDNLGMSNLVTTVTGEQDWISKNTQHTYAIVKLENDELIGNCGFVEINQQNQCAEVGIFIGDEKNRNSGFGAEALSLLLDFGFDYLNLNNIMLKLFAFNERAAGCYKKLGFKEIGRRRQAYYLKGAYHDQIYMDILRSEWQQARR